jgi:hypothetical protein
MGSKRTGNKRKARREEAIKKAKRKKIIGVSVLAVIVVFITSLIVVSAVQSNIRLTGTEGVDVDLSRLSLTMLSAEVNRITRSPNDYLGRTIKMSGLYYAIGNRNYIAVREPDPCCPLEGLEFIVNSENSGFNDYDYPANTTRIEVTGVFQSHVEHGHTSYYLAVDNIIILE